MDTNLYNIVWTQTYKLGTPLAVPAVPAPKEAEPDAWAIKEANDIINRIKNKR